MNQKTQVIPGFDSVKFFRAVKEKISVEIDGMSFEQLKAYLQEGSEKFQEMQAGDTQQLALQHNK